MNLSEVSTTQIAIVIAIAVMVVAGVTVWRFIRKTPNGKATHSVWWR